MTGFPSVCMPTVHLFLIENVYKYIILYNWINSEIKNGSWIFTAREIAFSIPEHKAVVPVSECACENAWVLVCECARLVFTIKIRSGTKYNKHILLRSPLWMCKAVLIIEVTVLAGFLFIRRYTLTVRATTLWLSYGVLKCDCVSEVAVVQGSMVRPSWPLACL